jgi:GT2 family glycosyltransferase
VAIDVVIPTYHNRDELFACLASLEAQAGVDVRALVCVDGSTDGTLEALQEASFGFEVIALTHPDGRNHGRAAARNLALSHLQAEHVMLLDSDMRLEAEAVQAHVGTLAAAHVVSVGAVRYANAAENPWARYAASVGRGDRRAGARLSPLEFATAHSAMRTVDLLAVGGFDESLVGYGGEDTELGLRLADERGVTFINTTDAVAWATETKTVDEALDQLDRYARTNLRMIRARHPGGPAPYWLDRLEAGGMPGRLLRFAMNPVTDAAARLALRLPVWAVRRRVLDYLVIRTVWRGYREGPR